MNALLAALLLAAPARADTATRSHFIMGALCEITANGPDAAKAADAALAMMTGLEKMLDTSREDAELSRLNRRAPFEAFPTSNELFEALHAANEVYRFSGGAFDPTFVRDKPAPGFSKVRIDENRRLVEFLAPNVRVSLDAIGKGYALDAAAQVLEERRVRSALIECGGHIFALGAPPGRTTWDVEVAGAPVTLHLKDQSVVAVSQHGRPGRIRDPRTGKVAGRKGSVAVVAADGAHADAWATALFVLGVARAPKAFTGCAFEAAGGKITAKTAGCEKFFKAERK